MLIQRSSVSVMYKRIDGIKKAYYNSEGILKRYFGEATVLPVPDDAPAEIPRIVVKTLHEHAQLNISLEAATFEVVYDAGYERDWNLCVHYIEERMQSVFEFLNLLTGNCYEYIGIISNIIFDELDEDGVKKISGTLLNMKQIRQPYDISVKYTFVEEENIFINLTLQNIRKYKDDINVEEAGAFSAENQIAEAVGAVIDINDRYGFNNDVNYKSDSQKLGTLLTCMNNIVNSKLYDLLERGEYR